MMVLLSIIGIVYGALVALAQKDWKRLVAYSSVSHMAMVMLGMFALNPVGITGSIIQQLNHGISTGALFLLVGVVYERRHTREISEYGGLSKVMPVYAAVFLIMTMSSIGLPTLNGFIGEFLILQGVFVANKVWAAFAGERRRARRGLHAVSLSADDVRQDREPEERAAARPEPPRVRDVRAAADSRGLDGPVSGAVPAPARDVGAAHHRAREPGVRGASTPPTATPTPTPRRVAAAERTARRSSWPSVPCDAERQAAAAGAATAPPAAAPRAPVMPARHLAQRLLLHPAGAGAHGGRAARARRRRAAAARAAAARSPGSRCWCSARRWRRSCRSRRRTSRSRTA